MKKITINMLSAADSVEGQGVKSAYLEQVSLLKEGASNLYHIEVNSHKKCDIMHIHTINPNYYLRMRYTKAVSVCYVHFLPHTLDGSIHLPKPIFNLFKKYVIRFYKKANYLVVVNPIFIKELEQYGITSSNVKYIPNYVSKEQFHSIKKSEINTLRETYQIDKDAFVVLGVGQVQTRKGVLDFVEIAKALPNVTFVWCGGFSFGRITDGYDELKKVLDNPPSNVKFLGIVPRKEMNNMYNIADMLFMPSYNELFPMSILEAVNSSKPLLLRDLELYEDILFSKYKKGSNNQEFIEAIEQLKENANMYQQYSDYAKEISQFYSKEKVLNMWIEFYNQIYEKKESRRKEKD